jgi:hypothetical protein
MSTLNSDQSLPMSDQTCAGSLNDYASYCAGGGTKDGGLTEGGPKTEGGGDSTGTGPTLGFTPSNVGTPQAQGVDTSHLPDVDIATTNCTVDTNMFSCAFMPAVPTKSITQDTNGVTITVFYVHSFKVESSAVLAVTASTPIAIVSLTTIDIEGQILVDGATGGGGGASSNTNGNGGPSNTGGGQGGTSGSNAGGGGSYCGVGSAGAAMGGTAPAGGISWGTATLVPFAAGASGGGPQEELSCPTSGQGGGAIQLDAATSITIGAAASINAGGAGGSYVYGGGLSGNGAGGGSGGAILLEAPTVSVTGILAANGGGGGAGMANGTNATANVTPAPGGSSIGAKGGSGSGGTTINGGPATTGNATGGDTNAEGGGGGGAGRIRINTKSGAATISGTLSPSTGTCTSQGTLGS